MKLLDIVSNVSIGLAFVGSVGLIMKSVYYVCENYGEIVLAFVLFLIAFAGLYFLGGILKEVYLWIYHL